MRKEEGERQLHWTGMWAVRRFTWAWAHWHFNGIYNTSEVGHWMGVLFLCHEAKVPLSIPPSKFNCRLVWIQVFFDVITLIGDIWRRICTRCVPVSGKTVGYMSWHEGLSVSPYVRLNHPRVLQGPHCRCGSENSSCPVGSRGPIVSIGYSPAAGPAPPKIRARIITYSLGAIKAAQGHDDKAAEGLKRQVHDMHKHPKDRLNL